MRWPLRNQILLPMAGLMLTVLIAVSVLNAYLSVRRTRLRIEGVLNQVVETLSESNFPLTDGVLRQMQGFVGAEFVLTDEGGNVTASSTFRDSHRTLPKGSPTRDDKPALAESIVVGESRFFHTTVDLRRHGDGGPPATLHILYPESSYRQAWRDAVYPPLVVGGVAIVLVIGLSLFVASRVTRPLGRLQGQVDEIAQGNFRSLAVASRDDEIADLSRSVNHMANMLIRYETEVRRSERLRTLGQLGGGIAHQLRNAVTGCRMAVELHARDCSLECESLDVATRQLELMGKYLQRFLSLGRGEEKPHRPIVLQDVAESVVSLVGPTARHVGVELKLVLPDCPIGVKGDADALEQLLANLLLNGIEAAACPHRGDSETCELDSAGSVRKYQGDAVATRTPQVIVSLHQLPDRVRLEVADTGCGPAADVASQLFEPFVTEKPDGTGLGLSVAQEIAVAHGGEIVWQRHAGTTCFRVELPTAVDTETTK